MANDAPDLFPYGVASFEPTASGVLLWTRTASGGPLRWEVATDPEFTHRVAGGHLPGDEGSEASVVVTVDGLAPATDHFYRFEADGRPSPVGRTRTLPDDDRPVRLGLVCCGDYSAGHFAAYRGVAEADVDVVVHLGDYVYAEVGGKIREVDPPGTAATRADYDARYRQVRLDPDLQALHQRHAMLAVIDDHDLADNAHEDGAKTHDPDEHGPWATRRDAAVAARAEWLPLRPDGPPGRTDRAQWRSVRLGSLAELVLLDTRLAGRDPQPDEGGPGLQDPERTMLGRAQLGWARERILDASVPWSIVVSSVVLNPVTIDVPGRWGLNRALASGYLVEDGVGFNSDGWDGYPVERSQLVDAFRARGRGGLVLSGDVHSGWAFEGPSDEQGPVAVEFTCPAVTSKPMGEMIPVMGKAVEKLLAADDGVRWVDLFARGHLIVDVGPTEVTGTWYASDSEDPAAESRRGSSWTTCLDRPGRVQPSDADPEAGAGRLHDEVGTGGPDGRPVADEREREVPTPVPPRPRSVVAADARRRRRRRVAATAAVTAVVLTAQGRRGR